MVGLPCIISPQACIYKALQQISKDADLNQVTLADIGKDLSSVMKDVDVFPLVKYYIEQLKIDQVLDGAIPTHPENTVSNAQTLCVMIANIIIAKHPLYKIEQWVSKYIDGRTMDTSEESVQYNDDRCGRVLDKLFIADRNTLLTQISAKAIEVHQLELIQLNNDSTSVSFAGAYNDKTDNNVVNLTYGFSKDHKPECKQVVFGLSTTSDGHVPISYELFDGNRTDDTTHIGTWDSLRNFIGNTDFVYIADSKLCTMTNLAHIHSNGGKFITILPKNRTEVTAFHKQLYAGIKIAWQEEYKVPSSRKKDEFTTYKLYEDGVTSEGYRIIWIHSDNKAQQDLATRKRRIDKALAQLIELKPKLNKRQLKTRVQIQTEIKKINRHGFFTIVITEHKTIHTKQVSPGKPTANTEYKEVEDITYTLSWVQDHDAITRDLSTDGIFPLINNTTETKTKVLQRYKTQPFLEKRFQTSKSVLEIAPVFLKKPERIEAMMFLYFIALMIVSLIERNIRKSLKETPTELKILPGNRNATAPTWSNIKEFFSDLYLSFIKYKQQVAAPKLCGLSQLHQKILKLLKVPIEIYSELQDNWWKFNLAG